MEFEEQEEEIGFGPSYEDSPGNSNSTPSKTPTAVPAVRSLTKSKYKECLKNHAVGIGGHAVDGCGEFIPAGEDGTIESLKCAACNCHRSFHRKEQIGGGATMFAAYHHHHHHLMAYRGPPGGYLHVQHHRPPFLALPSTSGGGGGSELDDFYNNNNNNHYQSSGGSGRKRFRTKFTQDQKEKMVNLAGRLGWRIQKQDEEIVQQFCEEVGIKRHVLKVWMHNNKHTLGKKP